MNILAVDPGLTTGFVWRDHDGSLTFGQARREPFLDFVLMMLEKAEHPTHIVYEKFTITMQTIKKSRETTALEIIGVLKWLASQHGCSIESQTPAEAKSFATDARLKASGMWSGAVNDHANDAARHLFVHMAKRRMIDMAAVDAG